MGSKSKVDLSMTYDKATQDIFRLSKQAFKRVQDDPEGAIVHARRTIEAICKTILRDLNAPTIQGLNAMVEALKARDVFPKTIIYAIRTIQSFGNISAHADDRIDEFVEPTMMFFSIIIDWYFRDYKKVGLPETLNADKTIIQSARPSKPAAVIPPTRDANIQNTKRNTATLRLVLSGGLQSNSFKDYTITSDETIIGRASGHIRFPQDDVMSRRHARIIQHEGKFHLVDMNSTNGVFILTKQTELKPGDFFKIGNQLFRFDV